MQKFTTLEEIQFAICMQTVQVRALQKQKKVVGNYRSLERIEGELDDMIELYQKRKQQLEAEKQAAMF